ncbi:hypothetical protein MN116_002829 [Schistosoma mekongi]|uniref:Uncharacterized protein n=1 Tax=Schistosoma mekongi TaxID=38744 RepID=A0AAE1ZGM9_SCHME|nr:hypothetical protein MN116_002829 [Schistosoma mekongi]
MVFAHRAPYVRRARVPRNNRRRSKDPQMLQQVILLCSFVVLYFTTFHSSKLPIEDGSENFVGAPVMQDSCPSVEKKHLSLGITISPTTSHLSCTYNFVTPMSEIINSTDNIFSVMSSSDLQYSYEVLPYDYSANVSIVNYSDLNVVPDLSVWNDRSVLILAVHRLNFSAAPTCSEVYICAIPNTVDKGTQCHIGLGEVSGSCREIEGAHFFMFPLAVGLRISVTNVGEFHDRHDNSISMIVTSGYRLPPGVFTCPSGFFACEAFNTINERRNSPLKWSYRICLPLKLWCDNVLNCPISGSDEKNCSTTPPIHFPHINSQIVEEYKMLSSVLNQFENNISLLQLAGYRKISEAPTITLFASVNIFWLSFVLLFVIILTVVMTVLLYKCKLLKRRGQGSSVEVTEGDYPADSDSSNVDALKNPIDNNIYSETIYRQDQLCSEENRNSSFRNIDNTNSSNNSNYYTFLPSDVQNLNAYLNSLGNQEITPLISRRQIQ